MWTSTTLDQFQSDTQIIRCVLDKRQKHAVLGDWEPVASNTYIYTKI